MKYTQMTLEERIVIATLLDQGRTRSYIADQLNRSCSTMSREIKRNSSQGKYKLYNAIPADQSAQQRIRHKACHVRFTQQIKQRVLNWFNQDQWSPEQMKGYCEANG